MLEKERQLVSFWKELHHMYISHLFRSDTSVEKCLSNLWLGFVRLRLKIQKLRVLKHILELYYYASFFHLVLSHVYTYPYNIKLSYTKEYKQ